MSATKIYSKVFSIVAFIGLLIQANAQTELFYFASSPVSFIGRGLTVFAAQTNGYLLSGGSGNGPHTATFTLQSNSFMFAVTFSGGASNLALGAYPNVIREGGNGATPALAFIGLGRANDTISGSFTVWEANYTNVNTLVSFAADFIQYDAGNANAWNQGSIRYNSSFPLLTPNLSYSFLNNSVLQLIASNCPPYQLVAIQASTNFLNWQNVSTNNISSFNGTVTNMIETTNSAAFMRAVIQ